MLVFGQEVIGMSTLNQPGRWPGDDFVSTEELVRRQGATPLTSVDELPHANPFDSDEECQDFLADLYVSRRSGI